MKSTAQFSLTLGLIGIIFNITLIMVNIMQNNQDIIIWGMIGMICGIVAVILSLMAEE